MSVAPKDRDWQQYSVRLADRPATMWSYAQTGKVFRFVW